MATGPTQVTDLTEIVPEILEESVKGAFTKKQVLMDSPLVSGGAVIVNGTLANGRVVLGRTIDVPYFGSIGEFADRTESQSASLRKIGSTEETATVTRASLAFEISYSAQNVSDTEDPYAEHTRQIMESARRKMESDVISAAAGSTLLADYYNATTPAYIDYQKVVHSKYRKLGDEAGNIVAMAVHSLVAGDLQAQVDSLGRPLFVGPNEQRMPSPAGIPLVVSDRMPLTSSDMGTVTQTAGSSTNPTLAVSSAADMGPWDLRIKCTEAGTPGTNACTFSFSTDGGNTWSADLDATASTSLVLTDTAVDSLVGNDGKSGVTATFSGAYSVDDEFSSTALLKAESQIYTTGACVFWYDQAGLELLTDQDILEHTDIAAMHLYKVAHLYRRRRMGKRPGVVRIATNVSGYTG